MTPSIIYSLSITGTWLVLLTLARRQFFHIALLGFPGVVMHELMHFCVGLVLLAKPASFNLLPRRTGNQWQFGSVSFTGLNLFNAAPVAYAPLLLMGAAWLAFEHWMLPFMVAQRYTESVLCGYGIACALYYSLPSVTDIKVGGLSTLFWVVIALGGWWIFSPHPALF
jgi:hypothetical protein